MAAREEAPSVARVFLKTDTQRGDLQVYRGARRRLGRVVGTQCEVDRVMVRPEAMPVPR